MLYSPIEQFNVTSYFHLIQLGTLDISYSNAVWIIGLLVLVILMINKTIWNKKTNLGDQSVLPKRWQRLITLVNNFIHNIGIETIGIEGKIYIILMLTIFQTIFILNMLGLIPYSYALTAQIVITLGLSVSVWLGTLLIGLINYQWNFFSMFMPKGSPIALAPFLIAIEILSYFARAISLGVRLAANITSGHILLTIIATFIFTMIKLGGLFLPLSVITFALLCVLTVLEIAIGVIQAYVFTLLFVIYLNDSIHLH